MREKYKSSGEQMLQGTETGRELTEGELADIYAGQGSGSVPGMGIPSFGSSMPGVPGFDSSIPGIPGFGTGIPGMGGSAGTGTAGAGTASPSAAMPSLSSLLGMIAS